MTKLSEAIRSGKVVYVGDPIDGSARNSPNPAFFGRVDCDGCEIEVILKIEPSHRLAKELIATSLASRVGIQHAPGLIGIIDPADLSKFGDTQPINSNLGYLCFASEKDLGLALQSDYEDFLLSPFALRLLVFDQLIGNFDRVYGNILEYEGNYRAFDHDKILFHDDPVWKGLPVFQTIAGDLVGTNTSFRQANNLSGAQDIAAEFSAKISEAPLDFLAEIANIGLFSNDDATALKTFLGDRAAALSSLVETFMKANRA